MRSTLPPSTRHRRPRIARRSIGGAHRRAGHRGYALAKRLLDVTVSAALLVLLAPLLFVIALLIKLGSPGPILYRQERCGLNGATFRMRKFRSMVVDADERLTDLQEQAARGEVAVVDAPMFKSPVDPRLTPLGRHLRRWSLDELPQLIDVLMGEMSLVGPRPLVPEEVAQLPPQMRLRQTVKPGITCIWQTSGRSRVPYADRLAMDVEYVARRSLWLDLALLARTPIAVLKGDGAC